MDSQRNEQQPNRIYPPGVMERAGRISDALRNLDYAVPLRSSSTTGTTSHNVQVGNNSYVLQAGTHANVADPSPLGNIVPLTEAHKLRNLSANALSEATPAQDTRLDA